MSAPPPRNDVDWANLSLAHDLPVNGHIEVRHHKSTGQWTEPVLVSDPNISVSGLSPGLNYGQQCYEGLKAFRVPLAAATCSPSEHKTKIHIFRPEFHIARLHRSAQSVSLPAPPTFLLQTCLSLAVSLNAEFVPPHTSPSSYLYIRPVLFGSSASLALSPPEETVLAVYVQPIRPYHGCDALDSLVLDGFDRAAPHGMGAYKVGGNYAPVWRHAERARELGYGITLHLDSRTKELVEEFSTSGFLGHRYTTVTTSTNEGLFGRRRTENVLVVPETDCAIASATSDSMVRLAEREGWAVEKKPLRFSAVGELDEVVAVGTAAAAVPIRSITRLETGEKFKFDGDKEGGGNLARLAGIMADIQRGRAEDTEGWCWEVEGYPDHRLNCGQTDAVGGGGSTRSSALGYVLGAITSLLGLGSSK